LSCEYFHEFSKKFKTAVMACSGAWEKPIHEKKTEVENLVTMSLEVKLFVLDFNFHGFWTKGQKGM
jgi:hypothetical protein